MFSYRAGIDMKKWFFNHSTLLSVKDHMKDLLVDIKHLSAGILGIYRHNAFEHSFKIYGAIFLKIFVLQILFIK